MRPHRSVILIPDSGVSAGMGHVSRSIALGEAFRHLGWRVAIHTDDAQSRARARARGLRTNVSPHERWAVAVIDSYEPLARTSRNARLVADLVVAIEDTRRRAPRQVRLLIRPAIGAASRGRVLGGARYILLPRPFWRGSRARHGRRVARVVVSLGSYPPAGALARVQRVVRAALPAAKVDLVRGVRGRPVAGSILRRLASADIAIVSGGHTLHEAIALGAPVLVTTTAQNQRRQVAGAVRAGAALALGPLASPAFDEHLAAALRRLSDSIAERRRLSSAGRLAIDGKGALRVARAIGGMR